VVFSSVPFGVLAFWWFQREGLLPGSWPVILMLLVGTGLLNLGSYLAFRSTPDSRLRLHLRLAVSTLTTAAVVYASGWGPMLVIGFGVGLAAVLQEAGSRAWRPGLVWTVVGVAAGQAAIALGWAPTVLSHELGSAVAVGALGCLALVIRVLGLSTESGEAAHAQLQHDALHEPLTGLWNRTAFAGFAEVARARARRDASSVAILFVDLDGFKEVNDIVGHDCGDAVLVEVAGRLEGCLRAGDVLARLGGDEFTVLLDAVPGPAQAIEIADRIVAAVALPSALLPSPVTIGASVGIAIGPSGAIGVAELLRNGDDAMYAAKRAGGSSWRLYPEGDAPVADGALAYG
jgi:diguanylate cyclase (GGDEF)-like protein